MFVLHAVTSSLTHLFNLTCQCVQLICYYRFRGDIKQAAKWARIFGGLYSLVYGVSFCTCAAVSVCACVSEVR